MSRHVVSSIPYAGGYVGLSDGDELELRIASLDDPLTAEDLILLSTASVAVTADGTITDIGLIVGSIYNHLVPFLQGLGAIDWTAL